MLEKLITNLKQSLPEALQKKLGNQTTKHDSDDHEDEDDKTSVEVRYEGFDDEEIAELQEEDESESQPVSRGGRSLKNSSTSEESPEEKRKKQISMGIKVLVILVMAWFVVDEFVLKKQDGQTEGAETEVQAVAENPKDSAPAQETSVAPEQSENGNNEVTQSSETTPSESSEAPIEDINIAKQDTPAEETINIEESLNSSSNSSTDSMADSNSTDTNSANTDSSSSSLDFGQLGLSESTDTDSSFGQVGEESSSKTKSSNDTFNYQADEDDLATPSLSENADIDSKISDTPVETPVPNYENTGRGLVYNCIDKHWACIDKPSYVQCHKNNVWNKSQGKKVECATKAVYTEDADCTKVQLFYVSNNEDTSFCN